MKFNELNLHPKVHAGVESQNWSDATPIQEGAIPHVLSGHDIAGLAQTGTGKTAAFLVPLMDRVLRSIDEAERRAKNAPENEPAPADAAPVAAKAPAREVGESGTSSHTEMGEVDAEGRASRYLDTPKAPTSQRPIFENWRGNHFILILVPTRELAEQVSDNAAKLCVHTGFKVATIYGGTSYDTQKAALKEGVQFIVATPGRLIDLYKEHLVDLNQVRAIVFDEADRMFDMGFKDDMKFILKRVPKDRQFLVFSATLNFDVLNVAYEFGANPVEINVSKDQAKADNVKDELYHVGHQDKPKLLLSLLKKISPRQVIVFSNFKHNVERISQFLSANGYPAMAISSLLTQAQRNRVMETFKAENEQNILVATDLAARGLDIKGVDLVLNFELPDDAENYVHRIGRTGRAGAKGLAISLVGDRDVEALQRVEQYLGHKVEIGWIEDSELITEFKPFPHEKHRDRPQGRFGSDRGGGRGGRPERGGGRDGRHGGDRHGGDRHAGPRSDRPRDDRPPRDDRGPRPPREDRGPRTDRPQGDRPQRQFDANRPARPPGDRPPQDRSHRPDLRLPRDQRGTPPPRSAGPNSRPDGQKFKHRPGAAPADAGVIQKVSKFFKKLFGGDAAPATPAAKANGHAPSKPQHQKHAPRQGGQGQGRRDHAPRHTHRPNNPNRGNQPK